MTHVDAAPGPPTTKAGPGLFGVSMFLSASLVFLVEPMIAKLVLPTLGGSAAVWNTSLAFFQIALLAGYGYAHLLQRIKSVKAQAAIHCAVLVAAALVMPLKVTTMLGEPGDHPVLWLLGVLTLSIGPPFAALSATAPLVQTWFARARPGSSDRAYGLYVASNIGSLLALLAYPIVVEPTLRLHVQTVGWSLAYVGFIGVMIALAVLVARAKAAAPAEPSDTIPVEAASAPPRWSTRLAWIALAAVPSSLMLGVTTHIATDIASAPFLWVAPLALYLLTFIIAFQHRPMIPPQLTLTIQAAALAVCVATLGLASKLFVLLALLHLATFFLTALVCHQALVARRPAPDHLTEFYLCMSIGGLVGGAFNAFLAPVLLHTVVEYPLVLVLSCLARPWGRGRPSTPVLALIGAILVIAALPQVLPLSDAAAGAIRLLILLTTVVAFMLRDRAWPFAALILALYLGSAGGAYPDSIKVDRSFFGVLRMEQTVLPTLGPVRFLSHGTTIHGAQATAGPYRCQPLAYYGPRTPIGQVFQTVRAQRPTINVGAIGMGAGAVAAYTRPGDRLRFYEIDPLVIDMATDPANFTYIRGCAQGHVDWVAGDARLTTEQEPDGRFDILLVDAFSSDSVPAHLLTVEAMRGYLRRIRPDGVVVLHLTNRNLDLLSSASATALASGGVAVQQVYRRDPALPPWVDANEKAILIGRDQAALAPFLADPRWRPADPHGVRPWTDDYSNLVGAIWRRIKAPAE
jgi:hypothetical protein